MKISVVINTFNSERYLQECLESVKNFDEIIICDMHSDDRTEAIAREFNCRIVLHDRVGIVEPARNYAIAQAANDWVLVVDSDEVIPETLRRALYEFVQTRGEEYAGLLIPRRNRFMGRFMRGAWPDYILRLVRKSKTDWPVTIHARARIDGRVARLPRQEALAFDHLDDPSVEDRLKKINSYTERERQRREVESYSIFGAAMRAWFRFFNAYILRGGFRDGKAGFMHASLDATYKLITIVKLWERQLVQTKALPHPEETDAHSVDRESGLRESAK